MCVRVRVRVFVCVFLCVCVRACVYAYLGYAEHSEGAKHKHECKHERKHERKHEHAGYLDHGEIKQEIEFLC